MERYKISSMHSSRKPRLMMKSKAARFDSMRFTTTNSRRNHFEKVHSSTFRTITFSFASESQKRRSAPKLEVSSKRTTSTANQASLTAYHLSFSSSPTKYLQTRESGWRNELA